MRTGFLMAGLLLLTAPAQAGDAPTFDLCDDGPAGLCREG